MSQLCSPNTTSTRFDFGFTVCLIKSDDARLFRILKKSQLLLLLSTAISGSGIASSPAKLLTNADRNVEMFHHLNLYSEHAYVSC